MLEGELDHHLGYDKHARTGHSNARNGYGNKTIKTDFGEARIDVPRDRDSSFEPAIVPSEKVWPKGSSPWWSPCTPRGDEQCRHRGATPRNIRLPAFHERDIQDNGPRERRHRGLAKPPFGRSLHDRLDGRDRLQGA